jgi:hypothetical protein
MTSTPQSDPQPGVASPSAIPVDSDVERDTKTRRILVIAAIVAVVVLAAVITGVIVLAQRPALAASVRDIFIILMALEFMVIGVALVVLIIQVAVLTNMLQHEVKPILESTSEAVNTVRGTTAFLSENLVQPVIKLNAYLAMFGQVADTLGGLGRFGRKKK